MSKLLEAANNVLWKLNRNESCGDYEGPARITRQDVTIRHLQEAVEQEESALAALVAAQCPCWVHNAALTSDIEALRRIALWYARWNNNVRVPIIGHGKR